MLSLLFFLCIRTWLLVSASVLCTTPTLALSSSSVSSMSSTPSVFAVNARVRVKPIHHDALWQELCKLAQQTHQQENKTDTAMLSYVIGQDVKDPHVFHFHEQYRSQDAFDAHLQAPHSQALLTYVQEHEPLEEPPVSKRYHMQASDNNPPGYTSPRDAYCLNVESCVKAEVAEEYAALMQQHQQHSRAEPGCLQFDWGRSIDDPNTFYIHEQYRNLEAYQAHATTPHYDRFVAFNKARQPYAQPQVVDFYIVTAVFVNAKE